MSHVLIYTDEDPQDVHFVCTICGTPIQFNRPGIGTPCPEKINGMWVAPECADIYMRPCNES